MGQVMIHFLLISNLPETGSNLEPAHLFIETTAETVRGKWFWVNHSIEEFSTAIGLE